ncbi:hypothetical protein [Pseudoduganella sp.]|uniref:hypothetical protein n=1 Tax=Pseudoduganella sp. TaxID=1880898 RepID=UPI0035AEF747
MENSDQRYMVQQDKIKEPNKPPVFARVMRSKEGVFEGVSFIKNKEKASILTMAQAKEAVAWAVKKKSAAHEYATKIIPADQ